MTRAKHIDYDRGFLLIVNLIQVVYEAEYDEHGHVQAVAQKVMP